MAKKSKKPTPKLDIGLPKAPKVKKLKAPKVSGRIAGLVKRGRISPKALGKLRGAQIGARAPRGGVGKGMAGM